MRNAQINTDGCFFCFLSWHVCLFVDRGLGMCAVTYWSSATSLDQQTNFFFHVLYLCSLKRESSWWGMLQPTCCSQSGWALMSKLRYWITCIGWEPPVTALAKLSKSACCEHRHHLHHHPHVHPIVSSKISACFCVDALITPLVFFYLHFSFWPSSLLEVDWLPRRCECWVLLLPWQLTDTHARPFPWPALIWKLRYKHQV